MRTRFSHIRDLLSRQRLAQDVLKQENKGQKLASQIEALLPAALRQHCRAIEVADTELTLHMDSPTWLTRARFLSGEILTALRPYAVETVKFRVRLEPSRTDSGTARAAAVPKLSEGVVRHLREAAAQHPAGRLRDAMSRLAEHHERPTPTDDGD